MERATPVDGVVLAAVDRDDTSQAYEDPDERQRYRARRTEAERIDRIERKQDEHGEKLALFGADLGELKGGVSTLVRLASERDERERESARARTEMLEAYARRRLAWWKAFFKIAVPLVIAVGGIITGVVAGGGK